jgi:hypothetical protein
MTVGRRPLPATLADAQDSLRFPSGAEEEEQQRLQHQQRAVDARRHGQREDGVRRGEADAERRRPGQSRCRSKQPCVLSSLRFSGSDGCAQSNALFRAVYKRQAWKESSRVEKIRLWSWGIAMVSLPNVHIFLSPRRSIRDRSEFILKTTERGSLWKLRSFPSHHFLHLSP